MVQFGRVEGTLAKPGSDAAGGPGRLRLTVTLETGTTMTTIREEAVPELRPIADAGELAWQADQWTQETIGADLATEGWEVIGAGPIPEPDLAGIARSATYAVRRLWSPE